jgi:hypothetical protein
MTAVGREALHMGRDLVAPVERLLTEAFAQEDLEALRRLLLRFIEALDPE